MKWHKLLLTCPNCKVEVNICAINSSADGEIYIELFCDKCQKEMSYITTGQKLAVNALFADLCESRIKESKPNKVKPPLKEEKISDHDFLKDLGIDDEK